MVTRLRAHRHADPGGPAVRRPGPGGRRQRGRAARSCCGRTATASGSSSSRWPPTWRPSSSRSACTSARPARSPDTTSADRPVRSSGRATPTTAATTARVATARRGRTSRVTPGSWPVGLVVRGRRGVAGSSTRSPTPSATRSTPRSSTRSLVVVAPRARPATVAVDHVRVLRRWSSSRSSPVCRRGDRRRGPRRPVRAGHHVRRGRPGRVRGGCGRWPLGRATLTVRAATDEAGARWIRRTAWPCG